MLAGYGTVSSVLFGLLMNLSFWPFTLGGETALSFVAGAPVADNLHRFFLFSLATSLGWDLGRALTTVACIVLLGPLVMGALRRAARRGAFDEEPTFEATGSG
jgi:energy-coupling factor transport system substrate-specific component